MSRTARVEQALAETRNWPVPHAAAVAFDRSGVLATAGAAEAVMPLASLTKPLAALTILVAVEEGAVDLDADVVAARLPPARHPYTLRHLLAHASGIDLEGSRWLFGPQRRRIYSNAGIEAAADTVAAATGIPFDRYLREALTVPLAAGSIQLPGSPARAGLASALDYAVVLRQFLAPDGWLHPSTLAAAATVQWPGLRGVLPGYGGQPDNAWGLGLEIRAHKSPHWTGAGNSPATFGHFGQSGTMAWVDPVAGIGLVALTDRDYGPWAAAAWPQLSDRLLAAAAS